MSQKTNLMILRKIRRDVIRTDNHYLRYQKLILQQVHRYKWKDGFDELLSTANVAYLKACETFNPEKGLFSTYLTWKLRGELNNHKKMISTVTVENSDDFQSENTTALDLSIFEQTIDNLSEEAQIIVNIVLETPIELIKIAENMWGNCKITIHSIKTYLRKKGWEYKKIINAIDEIKEALNE